MRFESVCVCTKKITECCIYEIILKVNRQDNKNFSAGALGCQVSFYITPSLTGTPPARLRSAMAGHSYPALIENNILFKPGMPMFINAATHAPSKFWGLT